MIQLFVVPQPPFYDDNKAAAKMLVATGQEVVNIGLSQGIEEWVRVPFIRDEKGFRHFGLEGIADFVGQ